MEVWKDIVDFPNYQVSNLGNVRNKKRLNILKPRESKKKRSGYIAYEVYISQDGGKQYHKKIHRLVAEAFIPNPDNRKEIDHLDQNPANNNVNNLKWVTRSENCLNTRIRTDNTTGHKNIYLNKKRKVYQVKIWRDDIQVFYKACKTIEEAIKARDDFLKN